MPFFTKSRRPSSQVKIVKAVNGGSRGHQERSRKQASSQTLCQFHGFFDAIDEHEFARQDPKASPSLMNLSNTDRPLLMDKIDSFKRRKRRYSSETLSQTRSRQSSNQRDGRDDVSSPPQQDFGRKPTEQEEDELIAASTQTAPPATTVIPQNQKRTGLFSRLRQTV